MSAFLAAYRAGVIPIQTAGDDGEERSPGGGNRPCIAAFSASDFRPDRATADVPALVIHGGDDQIVPFEVSGKRSADLIKGAVLKACQGGGHALPGTGHDRLHADLPEFIDS